MKSLFKCLLASLVLICVIASTQAQPIIPPKPLSPISVRNNPVTVQSPNVAAFRQYTEVPVSFFTGVPKIEIPLYTLTARKINVPITLSYHASGFRPDQHPGWVGMGWNLTAGGAITRTVKDIADESHYATEVIGTSYAGFWYSYNNVYGKDWSSTGTIRDVAKNVEQWVRDTEPDEFSFSYPGGSGSFYLEHRIGGVESWKVKCDKPVKIVFDGVLVDMPFEPPKGTAMLKNTQSFGGFTIIDENGRKFIFGGNTDAMEYGIDLFEMQYLDYLVPNAWHLTKIIDVDGTEVVFEYERDHYISQVYYAVNVTLKSRSVTSGTFSSTYCSTTVTPGDLVNFVEGKLISPVYLKRITALGKTVMFDRSSTTELRYEKTVAYGFNYEQYFSYTSVEGIKDLGQYPFIPLLAWADPDLGQPQGRQAGTPGGTGTSALQYNHGSDTLESRLKWKQLDLISILDEANTLTNSFSFGYSMDPNQRLTLLSLREWGKNSSPLPPYKFYYDTSVPLPPYLSNKTDHWGFYNGTEAPLSGTDPETGLPWYQAYYGKKQPNATYLYAGTLNKIVYPTGGSTVFTFEPHRYGKKIGTPRSSTNFLSGPYNNLLAGGLRIKKIDFFDADNTVNPRLTKEYFYIKNYTNNYDQNYAPSSGILGGDSKYYYDDYRVQSDNDPNTEYSKSVFSSQSVLPASNNSQGSHVGYSEVTEKLSDGSYTKYFFSNFDTGNLDEDGLSLQSRTEYEPYSSLEAQRGLLKKQQSFSVNETLLHEKMIDYTALDKDHQFVWSVPARYFPVCPSQTNAAVLEGTAYKIYTYSYLPSKETENIYNPSGTLALTKVKDYTYDLTTRLVKTELSTDNSKGQSTKVNYRYPTDYSLEGLALVSEAAGIKNLQTKHVIGTPVETYVQLSDNAGANFKTVSSQYTTYKEAACVPDAVYSLETAEPIANYTPVAISLESVTKHASLKKKISFLKYDDFNNPKEFQNADDFVNCFLWDFNGALPIAQVVNATSDQVAYTGFENFDLSGNWTSNISQSSLSEKKSGLRSCSGNGTVSNVNLPAGDYVVSFWAKQRSTTPQVSVAGSSTVVIGVTKPGWNCYETAITSTTGVTLTLNNIYLDDLRVYPKNAQMTTYVYDYSTDLLISSSDPNNKTTYYEYDQNQRLKTIKDSMGNILKHYDYNYRTSN